jgi:hypothetical protein
MNYGNLLLTAEDHRKKMNLAADPIGRALRKLLGDDADIMHQPSPCWCVMYCIGNAFPSLAPIGNNEIDELLSMPKTKALKYLSLRSI